MTVGNGDLRSVKEEEVEVDSITRSRARTQSVSVSPEPAISWFTQLSTYFVYTIALLMGVVRDLFAKLTGRSRFASSSLSKEYKEYAPILSPLDSFYSRRLYFRYRDVWNRPVASAPGAEIDVVIREEIPGTPRLRMTDKTKRCVNLGSYNYLGFADDWKNTCADRVIKSLNEFGVSPCASRSDAGLNVLQEELEEKVAKFVGKEAAVCFNMGYGTNATAIPAIVGKGCLLVSDSLNHTSIVNGARGSGAKVQVFRHNDVDHLEEVLRNAIIEGQPLTNRPWKKILVLVEGVYSMEGEICRLAEIVAVTKKFKCYLYVDEAHSIGALGPTGRGVCEHTGVDPADIDILMGTFTKSFGAMGGYIAGDKDLIDFLRANSCGTVYANTMSPVVCQQIITSLRIIDGEDGTDIGKKKLQAIKDNSNHFRTELIRMGCEVLGDPDSPVVPLMLYIPTKISLFSRLCFERGLAVVVVGFPAVPLNASRARFCISAGHTREQIDHTLDTLREVVDILKLRYTESIFG